MKPSIRAAFASLFLTAVFSASSSAAPLEPASVFSDHMVLQRDAEVPVWGKADAGDTVTVSFASQSVSATADDDGNWRAQLKPLKASADPGTMKIHSKGNDQSVKISNVLVGDVWVGSGQSNMAGKVAGYAKNDETLAELSAQAPFPKIRLLQGGPKPTWKEATAETVPQFSAILFAFGERLHRELDVPVGLIVGAVGGTPSGSWIPSEFYENSGPCRNAIAEFSKTWDPEKVKAQHEKVVTAWEERVKAAKAKGEKPKGRAPRPPVKPGETTRGGVVGGLYQRFISASQGYRIRGVLWDQGESGTGVLGVDQHTMMSELIRGWREVWGQGEFPFIFVQKPSGGGCAWTNDDPITRNGEKFSALPDIARIGSGEGRFLYHRLMRDNPDAWMVPASDLGASVHPRNKWGYGNRAAEVALQKIYETGVQAYGPRYQSHKVEGGKVIVTFDETGKGLAAAHAEAIQGFALAGADNQWRWADAKIDGDTVIVSSEQVLEPTQVRYGWSQKRTWANLFNQDGLPALTFTAGGK